jgi:CubicO group peptidase (beta-lactamase class C family)
LAALHLEAGGPALIAADADGFLSVAGVRQAGAPTLATTNDKWHIGSCTKSMTATLAARLAEQGRIRWTDTVGEVLKTSAPDMREVYRTLTYRHLFSHRSGLPGNIGMADFLQFKRINPDPRAERIAFARKALAMAPKGPAETTFEYSNNGYVIAGAMREAATGESWESLMRADVFKPLGMTGAGFGAPGTAGTLEQPVGHAKKLLGEARQPYPIGKGVTDNPAVLGPAGTVHAKAADMLAYLRAHRDAGAFLSKANWDMLHTPPFGVDYSLGWIVTPKGALWHNGSNTLWYAEIAFNRVTGKAAFAATNDGFLPKAEPAVNSALRGLMV